MCAVDGQYSLHNRDQMAIDCLISGQSFKEFYNEYFIITIITNIDCIPISQRKKQLCNITEIASLQQS